MYPCLIFQGKPPAKHSAGISTEVWEDAEVTSQAQTLHTKKQVLTKRALCKSLPLVYWNSKDGTNKAEAKMA